MSYIIAPIFLPIWTISELSAKRFKEKSLKEEKEEKERIKKYPKLGLKFEDQVEALKSYHDEFKENQ